MSTSSASELLGALEQRLAQRADADALRCAGRALTCGELVERVAELAGRLQRLELGPEPAVAALTGHGIDAVVTLLAILRAGGVWVPLDPQEPGERLAAMARRAGLKALVCAGPLPAALAELDLTRDLPVLDPNPAPSRAVGPASASLPVSVVADAQLAYVLFTSGSTGQPCPVGIPRGGLATYVREAVTRYGGGPPTTLVHSPLGFDFTLTTLLPPLLLGHCLELTQEVGSLESLAGALTTCADALGLVKLTPSHLRGLERLLPLGFELASAVRLVVGGEPLAHEDLRWWWRVAPNSRVFNEYGPTESTVGCTIHELRERSDGEGPVALGQAIGSVRVAVLDEMLEPVGDGEVGELYIAGDTLARGYLGDPRATALRFVPDPHGPPGSRMHRSGDLVRTSGADLFFVRRRDRQVKIRGHRVELGAVEAALRAHPLVAACHVGTRRRQRQPRASCVRCQASDRVPNGRLDEAGVCLTCRRYERHADAVRGYFLTPTQLRETLLGPRSDERAGEFDCLLLYSGGKDSTYALWRLIDMGVRVLTFTLDNGYVSETAWANIAAVCAALGVENVRVRPKQMDAVFRTSLATDCAVCTGCFRAIDVYAMRVAKRHGIRVLVNGLSRAQIVERKIAPYLARRQLDLADIEHDIERRRYLHHARGGEISRLLRVVDNDLDALQSMRQIDFYRYVDVDRSEVLRTLADHLEPWKAPADTGMCSSNCRINDVGIHVHQLERGYHYYEVAHAWELRLGQLDAQRARAELDAPVDTPYVREILDKLAYRPALSGVQELCAWVVPAQQEGSEVEFLRALRRDLGQRLPKPMIPSHIVSCAEIPLNERGKVDEAALVDARPWTWKRPAQRRPAGRSQLDRVLEVWQRVLATNTIEPDDDFFLSGGDSLLAAELMVAIESTLRVSLPTSVLLTASTPRALTEHIQRQREQVESSDQGLVCLTPGQPGATSLICISPTGFIRFAPLARALGDHYPVFVCQVPGFDGGPPLTTVEAIATWCLERILRRQAERPFILAGQCFGGLVAVEIARQLGARGQMLAPLVLIDSYRPAQLPSFAVTLLDDDRALGLVSRAGARWQLGPAAHLPYISTRDAGADARATTNPDRGVLRYGPQIIAANWRAEFRYRPRPLDIPIAHIMQRTPSRPASLDRRYGWRTLARAGLREHLIPGEPGGLLRPPKLELVADTLRTYLEAADQASRTKP